MKRILLLSVYLTISFCSVFSQCPQPGLNIQSVACGSPQNLKIDTTTCTALKVKWQGKQSQTYKIEAEGSDPLNKKIYEVNSVKYSCDNNGNCQAFIPVKEGTDVKWSVQAKCTQNGGTLYGYKINGPQASIPVCKNIPPLSNILKAYPNPTTGDLNVEYNGAVTRSTKFIVSDVSGKNVFSIAGNSVSRVNNGYRLNLHSLNTGTYVLKIINGNDTRQVKFVLIKD